MKGLYFWLQKEFFLHTLPLAPLLATTISIYKHSASLFLRRGTFKFSSLRPCVYFLYFTPPRRPNVRVLECFTHVLSSWCITLGRITLSCRDLIPYTGISHLNEYETFTGLHWVLHRQSAIHWIKSLSCFLAHGAQQCMTTFLGCSGFLSAAVIRILLHPSPSLKCFITGRCFSLRFLFISPFQAFTA